MQRYLISALTPRLNDLLPVNKWFDVNLVHRTAGLYYTDL